MTDEISQVNDNERKNTMSGLTENTTGEFIENDFDDEFDIEGFDPNPIEGLGYSLEGAADAFIDAFEELLIESGR